MNTIRSGSICTICYRISFLPCTVHLLGAAICQLSVPTVPLLPKTSWGRWDVLEKPSSGKEQALGSEPGITGIRERWTKRCVIWCAPARPSSTFAGDVLAESRAQETEGFVRKELEIGTNSIKNNGSKYWILQIYLRYISVQCYSLVTRIKARNCLKKIMLHCTSVFLAAGRVLHKKSPKLVLKQTQWP